jgi:hypothetical protein
MDDKNQDQTGAASFDFTDKSNAVSGDEQNEKQLHKHRVKVKKRIRVKRNSGSKRSYKKKLEKLIWVLFILGFIAALVILYKQLGINDSRYKTNKRVQKIEHTQSEVNLT